MFTRTTISLPNGQKLEIVAEDATEENKYIQSAELNGRPWDKPWFSHDDISHGGTLVLHMGRHPNKQWGASPDVAPPSMDNLYRK